MNYASYFEITLALSVTSLVVGYLLGSIGIAGIRTDLVNVKTDFENLKNRLIPNAPTAAVIVPAVQ